MFKEGQQAVAGLEATLKSTGGAAGMTREQVDKLAERQAHNTLFMKDATQGAEALLLGFTHISEHINEQAIPLIQDMATKLANGGEVDLKSATELVGQALENPIDGIKKLHKAGVDFSPAQQYLIKKMVESGDAAGAQAILLEGLNKKFGGSAEAARKAAGGQGDFKESMHELEEQVGSLVSDGLNLLYPIISQLVTGFLNLVNGVRSLPEFIRENKELFIALGVAIVALNAAQIKKNAIDLASIAIEKGRAIATESSTAAQWLLNAAMTANPIGLIVAALALLVGG